MNDLHLDAPLALAHRATDRSRVAVVPLLWTLTAVAAACTPSSADVGDGSSSTDGPDPDTSDSSDSSSTPPDVTDGALDAGEDTLADGCWEYAGELDYFDQVFDIPFEPLVCAELPIPCETVALQFVASPDCETGVYGFTEDTLDNRDAIEAAARCVLTALRDGTPASHVIDIDTYEGIASLETRYTVLDAGVLTFVDSRYDNAGYASERYLSLRDAAWFDACLAAPDLEGLVPCLWGPIEGLDGEGGFACGDVPLGPVDASACVGETPACP